MELEDLMLGPGRGGRRGKGGSFRGVAVQAGLVLGPSVLEPNLHCAGRHSDLLCNFLAGLGSRVAVLLIVL